MNQDKGYRGKAENNSRLSTKQQKKLITDLRERYPSLSELPNNIIRDILENVGWDVDKAIEQFDDEGSQTLYAELATLQSEAIYSSSSTPSEGSVASLQNNPPLFSDITGSRVNPIKVNSNGSTSEFEDWIAELQADETNVDKVGVPKDKIYSSIYSAPTNSVPSPKIVKNKTITIAAGDPQRPHQYFDKEREATPRSPRIATLYDAIVASSSKIAQSECDDVPVQELNNNVRNNNNNSKLLNGNPFPQLNGVVNQKNEMGNMDSRLFLHNGTTENHNGEIFTPTDNEYFDLQLNTNFVTKLFQEYSNPFGPLDVGRLTQQDLNIHIPPKLAFELFEILCLHIQNKYDHEHAVEDIQRDFNSSPNGMDDDYTEEQLEDIIRMSELTLESSPDFQKIMEFEMRLNEHEERRFQNQRSRVQLNLASKLVLDKLSVAFPSLPAQEIERIYGACNCKYDVTLNALIANYGSKFVPERLTDNFQSNHSVVHDSRNEEEVVPYEEYIPSSGNYADFDDMTPEELRLLALDHYKLRRDCRQKINKAKKESNVVPYDYMKEYRKNDEIMREANKAAARKFLERHNGTDKDKLDLHFLYVHEAIRATQIFLRERTKYMEETNLPSLKLAIITGKGKNSDQFGSRLRPSILCFLTKQHYNVVDQQGFMEVILKNQPKQGVSYANGKSY